MQIVPLFVTEGLKTMVNPRTRPPYQPVSNDRGKKRQFQREENNYGRDVRMVRIPDPVWIPCGTCGGKAKEGEVVCPACNGKGVVLV